MNYLSINDYDSIKEVLKNKGKWDDKEDESLVMLTIKRKQRRIDYDSR